MRPNEFVVGPILCLCLSLLGGAPASADAAPGHSLAELAWLAGAWEGSGSGLTVDSAFGEPKAGVLLAQGRYLSPAGALAFFEFDLFKDEGGQVTLTPYPEGQQGVTFVATELAPGRVVFVNPENPFPKLIEFRLTAGGTLYTHVEGDQHGVTVRQDFQQTKKGP